VGEYRGSKDTTTESTTREISPLLTGLLHRYVPISCGKQQQEYQSKELT